MKLLKYFVLLNILFVSYLPICSASNSPHDAIASFDIMFYRPQNYGLKDVMFETRIIGLTKRLKERIGREKLDDVFFRVYWAFPGKYDIEVLGLGKGFVEIKRELSELVMAKIDFVIPKKIAGQLRSYQLTGSKNKGQYIIKGVDKSSTRDVSEAFLSFNGSGLLAKLRMLSPAGERISRFKYKRTPWSHNKYVINTMTANLNIGIKSTVIKNTLEYKKISEVGVPIRIVQEVTEKINRPKGLKDQVGENKSKSVIVFSKHVINEGVAMRYFASKKKRNENSKQGIN